MTLLETLDNENLDAFLKQLSEIDFLHKYYTYDSPKGICIDCSTKMVILKSYPVDHHMADMLAAIQAAVK